MDLGGIEMGRGGEGEREGEQRREKENHWEGREKGNL